VQITAAYHAVYPLSHEEIALVPDLMAVRQALSLAISSWRAALHPDEAPYILRSHDTVSENLRRLASARDGGRFVDRVARFEKS